MSLFQSIFLGIVQGLTEFLPVSSSGHLVIFQHFLDVDEASLAFDVAVHVGTLLSIFTVYRVLLFKVVQAGFQFTKDRIWTPEVHLIYFVILGSIPTAIMGFGLKDFFESLFANLDAVAFFLLLTGMILFFTRFSKTETGPSMDALHSGRLQQFSGLNFKKALLIGIAQGFAIAPGISRSGATIATGILLGVPRNEAAMFSFVLSIPAILGAGLLEFKDVTWTAQVAVPMVTGLISAYLFGLLGLWLVLRVVNKGRLEVFSVYLWLLGTGLLLWRA